jgi:hypothetical protein
MMEVKLVIGSEGFEKILPIVEEYWRESPLWRGRGEYTPTEIWRMQCRLGLQCTDPFSSVLIAVDGDEIHGFTIISVDRNNNLKEGIGTLINDFFVRKKSRGTNEAFLTMWTFIHRWATVMNASSIDADISLRNTAVIRMMESRGFKPLWTRYRRMLGKEDDGKRSDSNKSAGRPSRSAGSGKRTTKSS